MRKRTRSILEELNNLHASRGDEAIQSTGTNIIESAVNLLQRINETYDAKTANELERRFLNSIRAGSSKKFVTGVNKVIESKK
tara:strand:+ start:124 stop:372 length:249 start_codon:yes stop_codon:yes gene_type:complete